MLRLLFSTLLVFGQLVGSSAVTNANHSSLSALETETNRAADQALKQTESLATSISFAFDYLATFLGEAGPPPLVIQAELQATTERIDGARSILVVARDGMLLHDAFAYPAPRVNLANRDYIQNALNKPGLQFGEAVVGRTSGVPFAPLSVFKPSLDAVFTAIIDPRKLREPLNWCMSLCGGAILTNTGSVIAASPPETVLPEELISKVLEYEENEGLFRYERASFSVLVAFRKSERFPIIVITSRAITNTISPVTE